MRPETLQILIRTDLSLVFNCVWNSGGVRGVRTPRITHRTPRKPLAKIWGGWKTPWLLKFSHTGLQLVCPLWPLTSSRHVPPQQPPLKGYFLCLGPSKHERLSVMWRKSLLDQQVVGNSDQQPLWHQQPRSSCSESLQPSLTLVILECTNLLPCDWLISYLCPQASQNFLPGDRISITITKKKKKKKHQRCLHASAMCKNHRSSPPVLHFSASKICKCDSDK